MQNLFYMSKQIVCRLTDLASRNGITKEDDIVLGADGLKRFADSPAIGFLEQHLYRYDNACYEKEQKLSLIHISQEFLKDVDYQVVDAEENPELTGECGIMQAPTLVLVKDGEIQKYVNASNIKKFAETR